MESIFRFLIITTVVLSIVVWSLPYFDHQWLSENQLLLASYSGYESLFPSVNYFTYWVPLVIWLILSVGLFYYNKFSRKAFVLFYIIETVLQLFYGMQVVTPYEAVLFTLIGLADGAIIAMMYLTSISEKFER